MQPWMKHPSVTEEQEFREPEDAKTRCKQETQTKQKKNIKKVFKCKICEEEEHMEP